jgi:hypothetical protein
MARLVQVQLTPWRQLGSYSVAMVRQRKDAKGKMKYVVTVFFVCCEVMLFLMPRCVSDTGFYCIRFLFLLVCTID